jgi:myo-inositol-1(or 4)-monophosphatase
MRDVELAVVVVAAGARVVRLRCGATLERVDKGGGDFATSADLEAEAAMLDVLRRERPGDAILGEETGRTGSWDAVRTWLIDPLCGTLNYSVKMRVVAVNAALRAEGRVSTAAVAEPFGSEIYWTDGQSAFAREGGRDTPLVPSGDSRLVDLNFDPPFPTAPAFLAAKLAADPEFVARFRPRVVSSSIALAWVATGQRAAYVTDGDVRDSVHFAAGIALAEAAGCVVTDLRGGSWGSGSTGLVAAASADVHAELLRLIGKGWQPRR